MLIALLLGRELYYASVGDSRIYYFNNQEIYQITQDHNYGEFLKKRLQENKISEEDYKEGLKKAAALTSYVGGKKLREASICESPIKMEREDVLLLQSDGLYRLVSNEKMKEIIRSSPKDLEYAANELLRTSIENRTNYQDNTSMILLKLK